MHSPPLPPPPHLPASSASAPSSPLLLPDNTTAALANSAITAAKSAVKSNLTKTPMGEVSRLLVELSHSLLLAAFVYQNNH